MSWREDLRPASFRDVAFFVDAITTRQGLHSDEQHFPGRDTPGSATHVEHLGVGPRRYQVQAIVAGDDVFERRDALEAALLEPGPGRLVHPYRGERVVSIVGDVQTTESRKRGGIALITFTVVETESPTLRRTPDTASLAEADLDAFLDELAGGFEEQLDPDVPDAFQGSTVDALGEAMTAIEDAYDAVQSAIGEVGDFARDAGDVVSEIEGVITAPLAAAEALIGAMGAIAALPLRAATAATALEVRALSLGAQFMSAMRPLIAFGELFVPITPTTENRRTEAANRAAVVELVRGAAIATTIRALLPLPLSSRREAVGIRDELVDALVDLVDEGSAGGTTSAGEALYEATTDMQASMVEHLSTVAQSLPEVLEHRVSVALPALVLAHDLYGDATREADILMRNDPPDPSYLEVDTLLEVLHG